METWEVIRELKKYPEKKFKCVLEQIENFKGDIIWSSSMDKLVLNSIVLNQDWEEVKEPISFIEAVKSNKNIEVEHNLFGCYYFRKTINFLYYLYNNFGETDIKDIILNGKYYIKD